MLVEILDRMERDYTTVFWDILDQQGKRFEYIMVSACITSVLLGMLWIK
jgi:hypothetical protein